MFSIEKSILIVIDIQGTLAQVMHDREKIFRHVPQLIKACRHLDIPVMATEQVPQKIGRTVPEIADHLDGITPITKETFSCFLCKPFADALKSYKRKEVILCGIESHVCVYQTAADLITNGYAVSVVADAVSSRTAENRTYGLERMKELGASITCMEMIMMELLRTSAHPKFRDILSLIK